MTYLDYVWERRNCKEERRGKLRDQMHFHGLIKEKCRRDILKKKMVDLMLLFLFFFTLFVVLNCALSFYFFKNCKITLFFLQTYVLSFMFKGKIIFYCNFFFYLANNFNSNIYLPLNNLNFHSIFLLFFLHYLLLFPLLFPLLPSTIFFFSLTMILVVNNFYHK